MKTTSRIILSGLTLCFGLIFALPVSAYEIQKLTNVEKENDFTLGPGKVEVFLSKGESATKNLMITNRLGEPMKFRVNIEDFIGSLTGDRAAVLLGEEKGPYSLRDYLHPELTEFNLNHGERIVLPVEISIPEDAEPGGLYGSVLVSTSPIGGASEGSDVTEGQIQFVSRIGSLFFVRVEGDAKEEGSLEEFDTILSKRFYQQGPISFAALYRNSGNIHLSPYGVIEIKNFLGSKIGTVEIDPYFAMPNSLRAREVKWDGGFAMGRYTATLSLNRGYNDIIDQKQISFWILPWKILLIIGIIVLFVIALFWFAASRFEIKRKE